MKKLTKRERKALKGPNAAIKFSLDAGVLHHVGGVTYSGRTPEYEYYHGAGFLKVAKGIPFVRVQWSG